ncbi:hypothetical protein FRB94_012572 [Tulasnella sp. JGI-2019a]|nr:hypothetical protein FRB93_001465 [Tulasnella sp. JGI-2019a]KAG9009048.1 hypothetical protein FRB94_012572 [Tulasnella sp. JGI-2019a]
MLFNSLLLIAASGLCLVGNTGVSAGAPGELLPRLEPYPAKAHKSLLYPRTLLQPASKAIPAGAVVNISPAHKRSANPLLKSRAIACQDNGYTVCASQTSCCPAEGSCCASGNCCGNRFMCCPSGDCCPDGYTCSTVNGVSGCCPAGQTCSTTSNECADANYVPCANANFCCPAGETCSTVSGQPSCGGNTTAVATTLVASNSTSKAPAVAKSTVASSSTSQGVVTITSTLALSTTPQVVSTSVAVVAVASSATPTTSTTNIIPTTMSVLANTATVPFVAPSLTAGVAGVTTDKLNPTGTSSGGMVVGWNPSVLAGASFAAIVAQLLMSML